MSPYAPLAFLLCTISATAIAAPATAPPADRRPTLDDARVFLRYAHYWDTPVDDEAIELVRGLRKSAPDFARFSKRAPPGSRERALVERFLNDMTQGGALARAGLLNVEILMDAWYEPIGAWRRARPWVEGLRVERKDPTYAADFEWLATRAAEIRAAREKHRPTWAPLETKPPSTEDMLVFFEFAEMWNGPRDSEALAAVKRFAHEAPDYASFARIAPTESHNYTMFDRYYCMLSQAAVLARHGLLRTDLIETLGDVEWAWTVGEAWWKGIRVERQDPTMGEEIEWLAKRIRERHSRRS
jgi:hypothetical protein